MTSVFKVWTLEQAYQAIKTYLDDDQGQRFQNFFSSPDLTVEDVAAFVLDADRRTQATDAAAGRWWSLLQAAIRSQPPGYLALTEPFAQHGVVIEEVYRLLPGYFEPHALLRALSSAYAPSANKLPPGISNTLGWTDEQIQERIAEIKTKLDWVNTTNDARKWWETFEHVNAHKREIILRIMEELANRQATITEFFLSYVYSQTENIQANLHYLDYTRLKKEEERKKQAAELKLVEENSSVKAEADETGQIIVVGAYNWDAAWWRHPSPGTTRVVGWTDEQIQERLAEVTVRLGWEQATGSAGAWLKSFVKENVHRPALVLRLAEELDNRHATITEFFIAYVYSDTENIQASLHYLDYMRLKKEEERKKNNAERIEAEKRKAKELIDQLLSLLEEGQALPKLSDNDVVLLRKVSWHEVPDQLRDWLKTEIKAHTVRIVGAPNHEDYNRFAEVHRQIALHAEKRKKEKEGRGR